MGIPRFYRWLSERYPLINENITIEQIPEFDNLYLDMNGIIHNCSHNNTGGLCVKEERDVFVEAFNYIARLFHIIRPKKLLYMAIDGCAPRAKMNQQRSRRFRAANDAREGREKAEQMGETITGTPFDSNCITPGTEFMARLTEHLQFFVCKKMQEDPLWQGVTVVLSGADVPGEGEHKIMDYVRSAKAQPDYDPSLRHCLYGLDADLIMLSLASHEPHFALLREEVVFGRQQTQSVEQRTFMQKDRFQLLHISLVREYLDLEFAQSTDHPYGYSLERVIDDFLLFCVLVGNDFLPHLPFAEIGEGGLDDFFSTYKYHLRRATSKQPWLTKECGEVDWENLASFLKEYAVVEEDKLHTAVVDESFVLGRRRTVGPSELIDAATQPPPMVQCPPHTTEEARAQYYEVKFGMDVMTHEGTQQQRKLFHSYLEGLQWVLYYYYRGPDRASWSWYYPYYNSPLISDLANFDRLSSPNIQFEVGAPFAPFQQLMAVLPASSKMLLPECYHWLFDSPTSPILNFYPPVFEIDMDGVKVPWGGVTLIPFIEPVDLLDAMTRAEHGAGLSDEEKRRNKHQRAARAFRYERSHSRAVESVMPDRFGSIPKCFVNCTDFHHARVPEDKVTKFNKLLPRSQLKAPGFPSLHRHPLSSSFEMGVKVFQFEARGRSLIVHLHPAGPMVPRQEEIERLLRSPCVQIDYPCVHRGKVVAVHTAHKKFRDSGGKVTSNNTREHQNNVWHLVKDWRQRGLAIDFAGGMPAGDAAAGRARRGEGSHEQGSADEESWQQPVVEVRPIESSYLDSDGKTKYKYKATSEYRLLHLVRAEEVSAASRPRTDADRFYAGARAVCIARDSEFFGEVGIVERRSAEPADFEAVFEHSVRRDEQAELQWHIQRAVEKQHQTLQWHDLNEVAVRVRLSPAVVRTIFGSVMIRSPENVREDVGMNLMCETKSDGNSRGSALCLPAYSAMAPSGGWVFSDLAVNSLEAYSASFPGLFAALPRYRPGGRDLDSGTVFMQARDADWSFRQLVKFCNACDFKKLRLVPEKHMALMQSTVLELRDAIDRYYRRMAARPVQTEHMQNPKLLYRAEDIGSRPPEDLFPPRGEDIMVGQRGIYIKPHGLVPCGTKGTVTGIYGSGAAQELELLLDDESFGATDLHGRVPPMRGLTVPTASFMPLFPRMALNKPAPEPSALGLEMFGLVAPRSAAVEEQAGQDSSRDGHFRDRANSEAANTLLSLLKSSGDVPAGMASPGPDGEDRPARTALRSSAQEFVPGKSYAPPDVATSTALPQAAELLSTCAQPVSQATGRISSRLSQVLGSAGSTTAASASDRPSADVMPMPSFQGSTQGNGQSKISGNHSKKIGNWDANRSKGASPKGGAAKGYQTQPRPGGAAAAASTGVQRHRGQQGTEQDWKKMFDDLLGDWSVKKDPL